MSVEQNLREMEQTREAYWLRYASSPIKLRWRALTVRHCLQVVPGEKVLEIGAGSGLWTRHLAEVFRGENAITAAVFNRDFLDSAGKRQLPNTSFVEIADLSKDLPEEAFDYIVGTAILCHDMYAQNLGLLRRLLKPGGRILFFEANFWNPQVAAKNLIRPVGRWAGNASCQVGMRKYQLMQKASRQGFTNVEIIPYDIIHPRIPRALVQTLQSMAFIIEQAPVLRELCGTLYILAQRPAAQEVKQPIVNLAHHRQLFGSTSVVVPCHNEEMNIAPLVDGLIGMYGDYIHEIVLVNDNSKDRTAEVAAGIAAREPRVIVVNRKPPNGVGRTLRDGYAAATGRYILTMDCDFVQILPEFRDLFDVIAAGHDGAIGSRFTHESILINYPFFKTLCNRSFHVLLTVLLGKRVRDISNNLKLYRAEILKDLEIEQPHFPANVETGLKPILAGYDVVEVPISWINRTEEQGASTFRIASVAPNYFSVLMHIAWQFWRSRRNLRPVVVTKMEPRLFPRHPEQAAEEANENSLHPEGQHDCGRNH